MAESENGLSAVCQVETRVLLVQVPLHQSPAGEIHVCSRLEALKVETNCLGKGDWGSWTHLDPAPRARYLCGTYRWRRVHFGVSNGPTQSCCTEGQLPRVCGVRIQAQRCRHLSISRSSTSPFLQLSNNQPSTLDLGSTVPWQQTGSQELDCDKGHRARL